MKNKPVLVECLKEPEVRPSYEWYEEKINKLEEENDELKRLVKLLLPLAEKGPR
jgi:hypothetical protein